jgi:hypothetical protein
MAYAKFMDSDYIFTNTNIDKNVDINKVNVCIKEAQEFNIQSVLGYDLYQKLMNDIETTGTTTGYYYTLLTEYIQICQAYWVIYHILPELNYHLTNKAVSEKHSEYSQATELDKIEYLRKVAESKAQNYERRITEYIINNSQHFPEYFTATGINIRPKSENTFGGFYFGKR